MNFLYLGNIFQILVMLDIILVKKTEIPVNTIILKAIDYNVIPNDKKDDSKALIALLKKADIINGAVVIQLPIERVILSEILYFQRSNTI